MEPESEASADPREAVGALVHLAWLHRDGELIAVDKPSGISVHRGEDRREWAALLQEVRRRVGVRVHAPHRLDRGTSGVQLFAVSTRAAAALAAAFREGRVSKRYLCVVRGWPEVAEGRVDRPLKHPVSGREQPSATSWRVLATVEFPIPVARYPAARYALLEAFPETGRWHQVRRHLRGLGHPLVGDTTHGDGAHNRLFREHFDCHRLLLHCARLRFPHPATGIEVDLASEPGDVFAAVIARAGWDLYGVARR